MKGPIQSVEVSYLLHATEDPQRLDEAVKAMISSDTPPDVEELEGHFGNRILRVRFHLTGDEASRAFSGIVARLPQQLRDDLTNNLGTHLDEHVALFLRLDKQRLVSGFLAMGTADPVRVKVKPRTFLLRGGAQQLYSRLLGDGE